MQYNLSTGGKGVVAAVASASDLTWLPNRDAYLLNYLSFNKNWNGPKSYADNIYSKREYYFSMNFTEECFKLIK